MISQPHIPDSERSYGELFIQYNKDKKGKELDEPYYHSLKTFSMNIHDPQFNQKHYRLSYQIGEVQYDLFFEIDGLQAFLTDANGQQYALVPVPLKVPTLKT